MSWWAVFYVALFVFNGVNIVRWHRNPDRKYRSWQQSLLSCFLAVLVGVTVLSLTGQFDGQSFIV